MADQPNRDLSQQRNPSPQQRNDVNVRLPRELVEQVRELARRHDRSLAGELRVGLADYVRRMREQQEGEGRN